MHLHELDTPTLAVDLDLVEANIALLMQQLRGTSVTARPHLKTAKSPEIARLLLAAGAIGVCVAKLSEAEIMAAAGIDNLLITSEVAGMPKLARLAALHQRYPQIRVVVDSSEGALALNHACTGHDHPLEVLIELDVGQHRCGVLPGEPALALARDIARLPYLRLIGLQGYEGHLQHVADPAEKIRRVQESMQQLTATADVLRHAGFSIQTVTTGGTGTCAICAKYPGITEIQPGSFVFLDVAYRNALGPASQYANALVVLSTVISRPTAQRAVVDAGLKSLSNDMGNPQPRDLVGVSYRPGGDEYGILEWNTETPVHLALGDQVVLIPSHIDTTVNLHNLYQVHRNSQIIATWPIAARGMVQ
ncbi:MAG: DSD1 family PLP-dependent enzyme [Roseiflexaceae bacterium]|nr:DSD1 family PLP-dependent enzyme [Roseiflexaceae bacterium]